MGFQEPSVNLLLASIAHPADLLGYPKSRRTSYSTRGRTLRVPAKNGCPPIFGARTLHYPPCKAILTTGHPGTRFFAGYPAKGLKYILHISVPQIMNFKWRIVCSTVSMLKRGVRTVSIIDSIHRPPKLAVSGITSLRWRDIMGLNAQKV